MSDYVATEKQCFFQECRYEAKKEIDFRGKTVKVCDVHEKRYGHSYEMGSKKPR